MKVEGKDIPMRKTSAVLIVLLTLAQLASFAERALAEPPHTGET